jgi:hypothetical protein
MFSKGLSIQPAHKSWAFLLELSIMTKSINTQAVYAVFAKADNSQAEFATQLFNLGIFSRADALPHVIAFVSQKYHAKPYMGQRGLTFIKDSAPHAAVKRILDNCFETVRKPSANKVNKVDPVAKLLKGFGELTAAQKRRFLAGI